MARRLTDSSRKAVMKIVGIRNPRLAKLACNSTPLIFGICTSEIKHAVSASRCDWRNSCADANVYTLKPSDFTRFSVAPRTAASSSTIEIIGLLLNGILRYPGGRRRWVGGGPSNGFGECSVF